MIAADAEIPVIDDCWNRIGVWSRAMPRCPRLEQVIHCHRCEIYAAAGRGLRDRPLPSDYRETWRQHYARTIPRRGADPLTAVLVFRIGGEWLALPADAVEEILDPVPVHSLPHRAPGAIQGLANIHGRLRPCASLAALLGIEPRAPAGLAPDRRRVYSRMVAIRRENSRFAFAADDVWGCHRHAAADLREVPATLARALARFTLGILPLEDKAVGRLDADLLFHALEKSLA
ncbi:MAG: chemotaxis protein CheW [Candidatus Competibacter sp.]|nr:chemotaxis protein CheW [Candidatus Competibacter sp.]MDG4582868.1 chemotaxis protein CheW [Candidatus Competibacter sp.]